jgi:RHS repeat-associated protein
MFILTALTIITPAALASYIGGDPPSLCLKCGAPRTYIGGASGGSLTEGNFRDTPSITTLQSGSGVTLNLKFAYNSYNADGSRCTVDTVLGYGWTHSYNILLFSQVGNMFRMGADGRVEKFQTGAGGVYTSDTGYFDTLVKNGDGSYTLTDKYKTAYRFATVTGTTFLIGGPVYRLQTITDRNGNVTTMTYSAGNLVKVTDTYGRSLQFTYNATGHLTQETDPLGRATTFTYDSTGHRLSTIADPTGKTTHYTYNTLNQIVTKVDGDGRTYTYQYQNNLPVGTEDGASSPLYSLANPGKWAISATDLALEEERVYTPSTTTETDGRGNLWQYQYDSHAFPLSVVAPDGSTTTYTYDPATLGIATMTDANGHTTSYRYDPNGNRTNMTDALGDVTSYTYEPVFNQVTNMTDPNGRVTTYTYDGNGNRLQETDPIGQTQSWTYDSHGNILSSTDKRGYTTTYQYSSGNLVKTTDPLGGITLYTYDAVGNRLSLTDANGHITTYTYDGLNRLTQSTDALGNKTTTTYDADGDVLSRTDANSHTTTYGYDLRDRLVTRTNALDGISPTTYDADNNVLSRTDENGHTTSYSYDSLNRLTRTTDPLGHATTTTYDAVGNIASSTDPDGHTTTYGYDALNRRTSATDPLGNTTTYEYATTGGMPCCGATAGSDLLTGTIDGDGKYTYYHYDELNRRWQVVNKSGSTNDVNTGSDAVTTTTYDADNNRIAVTDPNNNTSTMTYDPLNRIIGMTNAAGDVSTTAYDAVGNVIQTVDPRGDVTTFIYDADNRLTQRIDSIGQVSAASYDGVGNVITSTSGNGNVTTTTYDAINRVIQTTDPLGHISTAAYDPVGNVITTTDRNGNSTSYLYDADDRQTSMTDALGNTATRTYDPNGNVLSLTDQSGHVTTYAYDANNRRIQETYPDTPSDTRSFAYDATGHRISRLDQNGQTTTYQYNDFYYLTNRQYSVGPNDQYTYDLGGRMTTGSRNGWTDTYTYDGANRVLSCNQNGRIVTYSYNIPAGLWTITYPSGVTVTDSYDLRSRLVAVNDGGSPALAQYTYDLDNNALTRANRNATLSTFNYNANDWITQLINSYGATLIAGFGYGYDNEGNRTYQMNEAVPSDSEGYTYDALYRLTNFDVGALSGGVIPSPSIAESYNLDPVGNWTSFTSNSFTQTRTHNAVNEVLTINANPLTYDGNGNLLNDGLYTYSYDVENRVIEVVRDHDSAVVGQYAYDALSRRILSVVNPAGVPATNVFLHDGKRIIEEDNAAGAALAVYTYGNYVDEVLTMNRGGQTYYYHPNALFNVEALTDPTGTPVERYVYDAYGEPTVMDGNYNPLPMNAWGTPHSAVANFYLFTGRQLDEESGLYFYRARFYDAGKGRFLQRDPLVGRTWINLYEYVRGNPVNKADPSGEQAASPCSVSVVVPAFAPPVDPCKDICDRAYKDATLNSGGGGVICDGATKCPCVFDVAPTTKGDCPALDKIVLDHETKHLVDVDCDAKKGLHRPPFKEGKDPTAIECEHRKASVKELKDALGASTENCQKRMKVIIESLETWIKANCVK